MIKQKWWGQFTPIFWGQFAPVKWGLFQPVKWGLFQRNFQPAPLLVIQDTRMVYSVICV